DENIENWQPSLFIVQNTLEPSQTEIISRSTTVSGEMFPSHWYELRVERPLQDPTTLNEHDTLHLSCKISGLHIDKFTWFKNGELIATCTQTPTTDESKTQDNGEYCASYDTLPAHFIALLTVDNVMKDRHEGKYECRAANIHYRISSSCNVMIFNDKQLKRHHESAEDQQEQIQQKRQHFDVPLSTDHQQFVSYLQPMKSDELGQHQLRRSDQWMMNVIDSSRNIHQQLSAQTIPPLNAVTRVLASHPQIIEQKRSETILPFQLQQQRELQIVPERIQNQSLLNLKQRIFPVSSENQEYQMFHTENESTNLLNQIRQEKKQEIFPPSQMPGKPESYFEILQQHHQMPSHKLTDQERQLVEQSIEQTIKPSVQQQQQRQSEIFRAAHMPGEPESYPELRQEQIHEIFRQSHMPSKPESYPEIPQQQQQMSSHKLTGEERQLIEQSTEQTIIPSVQQQPRQSEIFRAAHMPGEPESYPELRQEQTHEIFPSSHMPGKPESYPEIPQQQQQMSSHKLTDEERQLVEQSIEQTIKPSVQQQQRQSEIFRQSHMPGKPESYPELRQEQTHEIFRAAHMSDEPESYPELRQPHQQMSSHKLTDEERQLVEQSIEQTIKPSVQQQQRQSEIFRAAHMPGEPESYPELRQEQTHEIFPSSHMPGKPESYAELRQEQIHEIFRQSHMPSKPESYPEIPQQQQQMSSHKLTGEERQLIEQSIEQTIIPSVQQQPRQSEIFRQSHMPGEPESYPEERQEQTHQIFAPSHMPGKPESYPELRQEQTHERFALSHMPGKPETYPELRQQQMHQIFRAAHMSDEPESYPELRQLHQQMSSHKLTGEERQLVEQSIEQTIIPSIQQQPRQSQEIVRSSTNERQESASFAETPFSIANPFPDSTPLQAQRQRDYPPAQPLQKSLQHVFVPPSSSDRDSSVELEQTLRYHMQQQQPAGQHQQYQTQLIDSSSSSAEEQYLKTEDLNFSPVFFQLLQDILCEEGEPILLSCQAMGGPNCRMTWYFNEQPIRQDNLKTHYNVDTGICLLKIDNATESDSGLYRVEIDNGRGIVNSSCYVTVQRRQLSAIPDNAPFEPIFIVQLDPTYTFTDGETLRLQSVVHGKSPLEIKWYKNDVHISVNDRNVQSTQIYFDQVTGKCTLTLRDIYPSDSGHYRCEATNEYGQANTYSQININLFQYEADSEISSISYASKDERQLSSSSSSDSDEIELVNDSRSSSSSRKVINESRRIVEELEKRIKDIYHDDNYIKVNLVQTDLVSIISSSKVLVRIMANKPTGGGETPSDERIPKFIHIDDDKIEIEDSVQFGFEHELKSINVKQGEQARFEAKVRLLSKTTGVNKDLLHVEWRLNDVLISSTNPRYRFGSNRDEWRYWLDIRQCEQIDEGVYTIQIQYEQLIDESSAYLFVDSVTQKEEKLEQAQQSLTTTDNESSIFESNRRDEESTVTTNLFSSATSANISPSLDRFQPPIITNPLPRTSHIAENDRLTFTVEYFSPSVQCRCTWLRNGNEEIRHGIRNTNYSSTLTIENVTREYDEGTYTFNVENVYGMASSQTNVTISDGTGKREIEEQEPYDQSFGNLLAINKAKEPTLSHDTSRLQLNIPPQKRISMVHQTPIGEKSFETEDIHVRLPGETDEELNITIQTELAPTPRLSMTDELITDGSAQLQKIIDDERLLLKRVSEFEQEKQDDTITPLGDNTKKLKRILQPSDDDDRARRQQFAKGVQQSLDEVNLKAFSTDISRSRLSSKEAHHHEQSEYLDLSDSGRIDEQNETIDRQISDNALITTKTKLDSKLNVVSATTDETETKSQALLTNENKTVQNQLEPRDADTHTTETSVIQESQSIPLLTTKLDEEVQSIPNKTTVGIQGADKNITMETVKQLNEKQQQLEQTSNVTSSQLDQITTPTATEQVQPVTSTMTTETIQIQPADLIQTQEAISTVDDWSQLTGETTSQLVSGSIDASSNIAPPAPLITENVGGASDIVQSLPERRASRVSSLILTADENFDQIPQQPTIQRLVVGQKLDSVKVPHNLPEEPSSHQVRQVSQPTLVQEPLEDIVSVNIQQRRIKSLDEVIHEVQQISDQLQQYQGRLVIQPTIVGESFDDEVSTNIEQRRLAIKSLENVIEEVKKISDELKLHKTRSVIQPSLVGEDLENEYSTTVEQIRTKSLDLVIQKVQNITQELQEFRARSITQPMLIDIPFEETLSTQLEQRVPIKSIDQVIEQVQQISNELKQYQARLVLQPSLVGESFDGEFSTSVEQLRRPLGQTYDQQENQSKQESSSESTTTTQQETVSTTEQFQLENKAHRPSFIAIPSYGAEVEFDVLPESIHQRLIPKKQRLTTTETMEIESKDQTETVTSPPSSDLILRSRLSLIQARAPAAETDLDLVPPSIHQRIAPNERLAEKKDIEQQQQVKTPDDVFEELSVAQPTTEQTFIVSEDQSQALQKPLAEIDQQMTKDLQKLQTSLHSTPTSVSESMDELISSSIEQRILKKSSKKTEKDEVIEVSDEERQQDKPKRPKDLPIEEEAPKITTESPFLTPATPETSETIVDQILEKAETLPGDIQKVVGLEHSTEVSEQPVVQQFIPISPEPSMQLDDIIQELRSDMMLLPEKIDNASSVFQSNIIHEDQIPQSKVSFVTDAPVELHSDTDLNLENVQTSPKIEELLQEINQKARALDALSQQTEVQDKQKQIQIAESALDASKALMLELEAEEKPIDDPKAKMQQLESVPSNQIISTIEETEKRKETAQNVVQNLENVLEVLKEKEVIGKSDTSILHEQALSASSQNVDLKEEHTPKDVIDNKAVPQLSQSISKPTEINLTKTVTAEQQTQQLPAIDRTITEQQASKEDLPVNSTTTTSDKILHDTLTESVPQKPSELVRSVENVDQSSTKTDITSAQEPSLPQPTSEKQKIAQPQTTQQTTSTKPVQQPDIQKFTTPELLSTLPQAKPVVHANDRSIENLTMLQSHDIISDNNLTTTIPHIQEKPIELMKSTTEQHIDAPLPTPALIKTAETILEQTKHAHTNLNQPQTSVPYAIADEFTTGTQLPTEVTLQPDQPKTTTIKPEMPNLQQQRQQIATTTSEKHDVLKDEQKPTQTVPEATKVEEVISTSQDAKPAAQQNVEEAQKMEGKPEEPVKKPTAKKDVPKDEQKPTLPVTEPTKAEEAKLQDIKPLAQQKVEEVKKVEANSEETGKKLEAKPGEATKKPTQQKDVQKDEQKPTQPATEPAKVEEAKPQDAKLAAQQKVEEVKKVEAKPEEAAKQPTDKKDVLKDEQKPTQPVTEAAKAEEAKPQDVKLLAQQKVEEVKKVEAESEEAAKKVEAKPEEAAKKPIEKKDVPKDEQKPTQSVTEPTKVEEAKRQDAKPVAQQKVEELRKVEAKSEEAEKKVEAKPEEAVKQPTDKKNLPKDKEKPIQPATEPVKVEEAKPQDVRLPAQQKVEEVKKVEAKPEEAAKESIEKKDVPKDEQKPTQPTTERAKVEEAKPEDVKLTATQQKVEEVKKEEAAQKVEARPEEGAKKPSEKKDVLKDEQKPAQRTTEPAKVEDAKPQDVKLTATQQKVEELKKVEAKSEEAPEKMEAKPEEAAKKVEANVEEAKAKPQDLKPAAQQKVEEVNKVEAKPEEAAKKPTDKKVAHKDEQKPTQPTTEPAKVEEAKAKPQDVKPAAQEKVEVKPEEAAQKPTAKKVAPKDEQKPTQPATEPAKVEEAIAKPQDLKPAAQEKVEEVKKVEAKPEEAAKKPTAKKVAPKDEQKPTQPATEPAK
ncbi:unnamed protein product, partial [Didymodactylos carnosus]